MPDDSRNIVMAQNMQISLKERLVRGMTAAVFYIDEENTILKMKKIINYSSLHNFEFTPDGLRMWKARNIGIGKLILWYGIILCPQQATCLTEEKSCFPISARKINRTTTTTWENWDDSDSFECPHLLSAQRNSTVV